MSGVPALSEQRTGWEHVPHGADIGVRGWGNDVAAAFEQAALATTAIVVDPSLIRLETSVDISCEAASLEDLLVEWLNAVIDAWCRGRSARCPQRRQRRRRGRRARGLVTGRRTSRAGHLCEGVSSMTDCCLTLPRI